MIKKQIFLHIVLMVFCAILVWVITDNFLRYKHKSLEEYSNNFYQNYLEKWLSSKRQINPFNPYQTYKKQTQNEWLELKDVLTHKKIQSINNIEWYWYTQIEEFNLLSNSDKKFLIQKDKIKNIYQLYSYSNKLLGLLLKVNNNIYFETNKQLFLLSWNYYNIYKKCNFKTDCFNNKELLNNYIKENELKIEKMNNLLWHIVNNLKNNSILKEDN